MLKDITIKGARENNLKNIDLTIPKNKLVVLTGVSGSGKTTLAFDTIFAEGQRRYIESLSSYARQFLGQMKKPDIDSIDGLSPSISIDQKTTSHNPRSTVGTITEIYDYLRLLYAHVGEVYCPICGTKIGTQSIDTIIDQIMTMSENQKFMVASPIARGKKGTFVKEFEDLKRDGYLRVMVDGNVLLLEDDIKLEKNIAHNIYVIVDRLVMNKEIVSRLTESVEAALKLSDGVVVIVSDDKETIYNTKHACPVCGYSIEEVSPRLFSFNTPFGACSDCAGLGFKQVLDVNKVFKSKDLSLLEGGINVSGFSLDSGFAKMLFKAACDKYDAHYYTPIKDLPKGVLDIVLYGTGGNKIEVNYGSVKNPKTRLMAFEGIVANLTRRYFETNSEYIKKEIGKLMIDLPCETCNGKRLNKDALSVKVGGINISELTDMSVVKAVEFFENLNLVDNSSVIAAPILKEINARLGFLKNVGLDYLTLSRTAETLSGGEAQRIRLASQIGSGLSGVLYILDEPSIGLHQRDNDRLLITLENLRDLGNSVLVVEHDTDTMAKADHIIDIGPGAGIHGGKVVAQGTMQDVINTKDSITGKYLSGEIKIETPISRRKPKGFIEVVGAKQNNLKNINVKLPVGVITAVTGVSGSGKSSLVNDILYPIASNTLNRSELPLGKFKQVKGLEEFDKVVNIDQSPIGRTPRSNPATYTNLFSDIRTLFASTQVAKERDYSISRFSFNIAGGRCEKCKGAGQNVIEMFFLPDVYVECDVCKGKRYNRETLDAKFKGKNISDVLDMTIAEGVEFFENHPKIYRKIKTLDEVGLGYVKLGQSATTLSGGEAQRVKLATELAKRSTGKSLYILDEPTTGLHMYDVHKLITILQKLADAGNTVVVIEHNLDVIKVADYIVDMGPEGGDKGGEVIATGTPEQVVLVEGSYTGKYLKQYLN